MQCTPYSLPASSDKHEARRGFSGAKYLRLVAVIDAYPWCVVTNVLFCFASLTLCTPESPQLEHLTPEHLCYSA